MYKKNKANSTSIRVNESYVGETIEKKIRRIEQQKEPITDGAPLVYTERKDGVVPGTNIRTDRWDVAIDAMSHVDAAHKARREERHKSIGEQAKDGMKAEKGGGNATE